MKVLLKQVTIVCSSSPLNGKTTDILIEDGIYKTISVNITDSDAKLVDIAGLHLSIGWMDMFANFADPGSEHKETLASGAAAAAAGGFTDVAIIPNTQPTLSAKTQVEYIVQKAAVLPVNIHPIAAVTKNTEGKELTEMYEMCQSGAVAFGDGIRSIQSPGVMLKALQYILSIDATIIQVPNDYSISAHGLMNEGIASTKFGLPGQPAIAEELMISRDIELLRYTGSKLHIAGVSTANGLAHISKAKADGLRISCSVTPYHAWFCDEDLSGYDTNLKVEPPLRSRDDMMAIRAAIINFEVDCFSSFHLPQHWDDKTCEFEYAKSGMISLEAMFGILNSYGADLQQLIEQLTTKPRQLLKLAVPVIAEGEIATATLFCPNEDFTFTDSMLRSRSRNSPWIGKKLKGKVAGIINNYQCILNN